MSCLETGSEKTSFLTYFIIVTLHCELQGHTTQRPEERHRCTEPLPEQLKKSSYSWQITCFDLTLTEKHTCQLRGRLIRLIKSLPMSTIIRTVSCLNDDRRKARFKEKLWSLEVLNI